MIIIVSLGDFEWIVGLEGVLEDELALDLGLLVLDLVLQPRHLVHGAHILRVDLGLEQVEVVDLVGRVARLALLLRLQLGLSEVDALEGIRGVTSVRSGGFFLLASVGGVGLLLVEDLGVLLSLTALFEILHGQLAQVLTTEHLDGLVLS